MDFDGPIQKVCAYVMNSIRPIVLLLFSVFVANADVIFTSERCNRATFGLRTVNGDPTRYKQCGPSGRVWIVPCAPKMMFDAQDRVCKESSDGVVIGVESKPPKQVVMRKYETAPPPPPIITTPAPTPAEAPAEFVFSTIRPKRPRIKAKTRAKLRKTTTTTTTTTMVTPTTPKIVIFHKNAAGAAAPAFTPPGRRITTTTTPRPVTHATQFVANHRHTMAPPIAPKGAVGMPHTLAPYKKAERKEDPDQEPLTTMRPEYTVRYNGKSMTENEFLNQLLHIVQHQKAVAERAESEQFARMQQRELAEERAREAERRRRLEEEAEAARAMQRARELERIRQEEERIEMARQQEEHQKRIQAKMREIERQREAEKRRREIEEEQRRRQQMEKEIEEEQRRRQQMERETAERETQIAQEAQRRRVEEARRLEKQMSEMRELETQRRMAAEQRAQYERMEKEREMLRQIVESQRNAESTTTTAIPEILEPIYRPDESHPSEIIRFTTRAPEWNHNSIVPEEEGPVVYKGCLVGGACELKYDYDSFCQHPSNPSLYLQCAPMYGRHGKWTERQCPDTLVFVVSSGRCEKGGGGVERVPYDPDNRVVIPRLPSETAFIQWSGNRVIDTRPSSATITPPRVYPPIPEPHQPQIYNTIGEFPKDLLPRIAEPKATDDYAQQYQNHIRGSIGAQLTTIRPPIEIANSYPIPHDENNIKSEIDLTHIHPLFPRVQPDFLSKLFPAWKFHDEEEQNSNQTIGGIVKPVIKQIALDQTEQFLDRLLADRIVDRELRKEMIDRLKSSNTRP